MFDACILLTAAEATCGMEKHADDACPSGAESGVHLPHLALLYRRNLELPEQIVCQFQAMFAKVTDMYCAHFLDPLSNWSKSSASHVCAFRTWSTPGCLQICRASGQSGWRSVLVSRLGSGTTAGMNVHGYGVGILGVLLADPRVSPHYHEQ